MQVSSLTTLKPVKEVGERFNTAMTAFCFLILIALPTVMSVSTGLVMSILNDKNGTIPQQNCEFQTNNVRSIIPQSLDQYQYVKQKIVIFFGTRPELIKLAPVIKVFRNSEHFSAITVFTGQHADIIQPFVSLFNITIDVWFNETLKKGQSLNMFIGKLFMHSGQLSSQNQDIWIIQGDTTSALVIAMIAFHKQIRIAHVEAGLRTNNIHNPFPEEFNRKTISSVATYHFAPTIKDKENLLAEGINKSQIFVTGNTAIDSVVHIHKSAKLRMPEELSERNLDFLILVTLHRRENVHKFETFYNAISSVNCTKCLYVVPVHPNPHASKAATQFCRLKPEFLCVQPLSFEKIHWVLNNSRLIITDSGGIQEEATYYNVPTLILRKHSERNFEESNGILKLTDEFSLSSCVQRIIDFNFFLNHTNTHLYGDGHASQLIHDIIRTTA